MTHTIQITHLKRFGLYLAEAFCGGIPCTFTQGKTKKEAEDKIREKLVNYYHIPSKQIYATKRMG